MNGKVLRTILGASVMAGFAAYAAPASAQATRTWVSGVGDDVNPCSRTAPCKTFAGSISKTAAGGEINCLDAGGYGSVTITKSISIVCDTVEGGVLASGTAGITVNGANAVVTLSGLDLDGVGAGTDGIVFTNGTSLVLDNVKIRGFTGFGVRFEPTATATLTVRNAILSNNGATGTVVSGGLLFRPAAGISGNVTISDTQLANNLNFGARVETQGAGSNVNATVAGTIVSNSGTGLFFRAPASLGTVNATVNGATSASNNIGVAANGTGAVARIGNSTISANATGLAAFVGATIASFGDNRLIGNTTNGTFATPIIAKQ